MTKVKEREQSVVGSISPNRIGEPVIFSNKQFLPRLMDHFLFWGFGRYSSIFVRFDKIRRNLFRLMGSAISCRGSCYIFVLIMGIFYTLSISAQEIVQPVDFSHKTHAGDFAISCEFCHVYTERSSVAGIPSIRNCIGCHTVVSGEGDAAEEISKIFDYWKLGTSVPWRRVYDLPDFVYFSHRSHSLVGIECTECHGVVEQQEAMALETLHADLSMGWCLDCHMSKQIIGKGGNTGSAEYIYGSVDCLACHK